MNDIVLEASVVNVEPQTEVLVDAVSDAEAVVLDAVVRLENNEFVLSSGGMYGSGSLIGSIPEWVLEAVNQRLTTGDGNIAGMVEDLQTALDALETGVNQSISNLESDVLSQSGLITSLRSDVDGNNAAIMNVLATKVTEAQASAVALNAIESTFGDDVEAFVSNIASTYVDADSAIATEIDMMQASLNGVSASITDISSITIETVQNPLWVDDGLGTDPDINDEPRWIDQAKAKKQLEVNADGVITGLLLESGQTSSVTVQADEFKLVATGQSVASRNPFTVNATTGDISFNGKVTLTGLGIDSSTTTIDGGKITTNTLQADRLKAGTNAATVWTGGGLVSANFNGSAYGSIGTPTAGFRLSSNAAGTSADPSIYGAYIKGGTIESVEMLSMVVASNQLLVKAKGYPSNYGRIHYKEGIDGSNGYGTYSKGITRYSSSLAGPAAGVGLIEHRICDSSFSIVGLTGRVASASGAQSAVISRSIDGGIYSTIATIPFGGFGTEFYYRDTGLPVSFTSVVYKVTVSADGYLYYVTVDINNT